MRSNQKAAPRVSSPLPPGESPRDAVWAHVPMAAFLSGGAIEAVNAQARRLLRDGAGRLAGRTPSAAGYRFFDRDRRPLANRNLPWARAVVSGRTFRGVEICAETPDGARVWLRCVCIPRPGGGGAWVQFDDLSAEVHRREQLELRLREESAVAACAAQSLCASSFCGHCKAMRSLLEYPFEAVRELDTVALFENSRDAEDFSAHPIGVYRLPSATAILRRGMRPIGWRGALARQARQFQRRQPVFCQDGVFLAMARTSLRDARLRTAAMYPLFGGEEWIGILIFASRVARRAWSAQEREVLGMAARAAGAMLARKHVQERMLQAQKMGAVGMLTTGLAHDFSNALTGIQSSLRLLILDHQPNRALREALQEIHREISHASELSRRLLGFSRPSKGRPESIDLNAQIRLLARMLHRALPGNIALRLRLYPGAVFTRIDPIQFDQALLNLVLNARDAMPRGGKLVLGTSICEWSRRHPGPVARAPHGVYACISVSDEGVGIAPEALARIFEPFYTTKKAGQGTGLGLAMVRTIAHQHHGRIVAESRLGEGSVFSMYLPLVRRSTSPAPPTLAPVAAATARASRETILIADDEAGILKGTASLLERYGYAVLCAESGEAAIKLHDRHRGKVALAILDYSMPGISGLECLQRIRTSDPAVKTILMSGYCDALTDHQPGVSACIEKPFDLNRLLGLIRRLLDEVHADASEPEAPTPASTNPGRS